MKIVVACFVGLVLSVGVGAEPVVEGRVRLASGQPVAGASVLLFDLADLSRGAVARATTDASGQFVLQRRPVHSGAPLYQGRYALSDGAGDLPTRRAAHRRASSRVGGGYPTKREVAGNPRRRRLAGRMVGGW